MVCASISLHYGGSSWSGGIIGTSKTHCKRRQMDKAYTYIGMTAIGRQDEVGGVVKDVPDLISFRQ